MGHRIRRENVNIGSSETVGGRTTWTQSSKTTIVFQLKTNVSLGIKITAGLLAHACPVITDEYQLKKSSSLIIPHQMP
jgi:hypothetical protein